MPLPQPPPIEAISVSYLSESSFNATALVYAYGVDSDAPPLLLRAFIDQGSDKSVIGADTAHRLRLPLNSEDVAMCGAGGVLAGSCRSSIDLRLIDAHGLGHSLDVRAFVMPRLTGGEGMPPVRPKRHWPHLRGLALADVEFLQRHRYDVLLGSDVFGQLLRPGLRQAEGLPTVVNTIFGWIVTGPLARAEHAEWSGSEGGEGGIES